MRPLTDGIDLSRMTPSVSLVNRSPRSSGAEEAFEAA
jgi:hypothetical protein